MPNIAIGHQRAADFPAVDEGMITAIEFELLRDRAKGEVLSIPTVNTTVLGRGRSLMQAFMLLIYNV
ncbi:hypothetical protein FACS1894158_07120 [Betaproteobacteria bacterium]|nr:hypothetical protein FACS1894158_07120 [Betaproteobacteria bacterium]